MLTGPMMLELTEHERAAVAGLVHEARKTAKSTLPLDFALEARIFADELPRRIRHAFLSFQTEEAYPALWVRNNPHFDSMDYETPSEIPKNLNDSPLADDEVLHILYSSLLGSPFTWDTIQNSNLINYVVPIREHEDAPISSGSNNTFDFHTEDAFHPDAEEYFGLFCLRNHEGATTLISFLGDVELTSGESECLFRNSYLISPNVAHKGAMPIERQPIFFGSLTTPYAKGNFNIRDNLAPDSEECLALNALYNDLVNKRQGVVLNRGDALYIDNLRTFHGRAPFVPQYGAEGRWLKRLYISGNIRRLRSMRPSAKARVVRISEDKRWK